MPDLYDLMRRDLIAHAKQRNQVDLQKVFLDLTTRVMCLMAYEASLRL